MANGNEWIQMEITASEMRAKLKELNELKLVVMGQWLSNFHPNILIETSHETANLVAMFLNKSIKLGAVPYNWRIANIVPLFKKGEKVIQATTDLLVWPQQYASFRANFEGQKS